MWGYQLVKLAHILLMTYWLGGDVGVFYSSTFLTNPKVPPATRVTVAKIMHWLDIGPRICLILMVPVGSTLAIAGNWTNLPEPLFVPVLAVIWIASLAWLALMMTAFIRDQAPMVKTLRAIDMVVRVCVIVGALAFGLATLAGAQIVPQGTNWLAVKLILFAGLVSLGLGIRIVAKPFGPAFRQLVTEGSSPAVEATLASALGRARPLVVGIWIGIVIMAFLGLAKPF